MNIPYKDSKDSKETEKAFEKLKEISSQVVEASKLETTAEVLEELSNSEYPSVRANVAKNPNTSLYVLHKLTEDNNLIVLRGLINNKIVPEEILYKLLNRSFNSSFVDYDKEIKSTIASCSHTPVNILKKLATDGYKDVRSLVADNPNADEDIKNKVKNTNKLQEYLG